MLKIIALVAIAVSSGAIAPTHKAAPAAKAATCSPTGVCKACKNCRYCKNCAKLGGKCSVCRHE